MVLCSNSNNLITGAQSGLLDALFIVQLLFIAATRPGVLQDWLNSVFSSCKH